MHVSCVTPAGLPCAVPCTHSTHHARYFAAVVNSSSRQYGDNSRVEQLTGLRFFAALGVLLCHAQLLAPSTGTNFLFDLGGHGVTLFFVLSGFVLTWRYDTTDGDPVVGSRIAARLDIRRFAAARFARIAPLYWMALGLTAVAYGTIGPHVSLGPPPQDAAHWAMGLGLNAFALQAWIPSIPVQQFWNAPGWSISAEFFFYACFPWLLGRRWLSGHAGSFLGVMAFFSLVLGLYLLLLKLTGAWGSVGLMFATRLPLLGLLPFVVGMLCCRLMRRNPHWRTHHSGWTVLALVLLVSVAWWAEQWSNGPWGLLALVLIAQLVYVPLFALLVVSLALDEGLLGRAMRSAPLVLLGHASYALYLLHWLPIGIAAHLMEPGRAAPLWSLAVGVASLTALSVLVYARFETPLRLWLVAALGQRRFAQRVS